ncbi:MAG: type I-C CRISPR-associated protein Cas8c/Csd1 [Nitrospira sp.]|nr:type I-C CRISPR-associated protein Cas8c/Csd1 [Nitrospira sp.]
MILQSLYKYYQRKPDLPREGFEWKEIPFVIELNKNGSVVQIENTRPPEAKKARAKSFLVPQAVKKASNIASNLLWGNAEYVVGWPDEKKLADRKNKGKEGDYKERLKEMQSSFVKAIKDLPKETQADDGIRAVLKFIEHSSAIDLKRYEEAWNEISTANPNMTFRLQGDTGLVCQRPAVVNAVAEATSVHDADGICLITGEKAEIERLHPSIGGVWGAQSSGANIVAVNDGESPSFASYGKHQGYNSPIGKPAAFAYTTALKHLLAKGSRQRLQVGDASTAFWADKASLLEDKFADIFAEPPKDDPDRNARAIKALYEAPQHGVAPIKDKQTRFFVLGLGPNAARIAVRFWYVGTVADLAYNIQRHFDDLRLVHGERDKPNLTLRSLLNATAPATIKYPKGDPDKVPPNLSGEIMRAILECLPYPGTLLQGAVRRIRAEQEVSYPRAAIVKACLNRTRQTHEKELTMSLDEDGTDVAYLLGRLFFVLEEAQWAAHSTKTNPGTNSTIRDRFYGAASATPITVFPQLLRLYPHHISKAAKSGRKGIAVRLEKLVDSITGKLPAANPFPSYMVISEQGRFAVGYYHQRHDFFSPNHSAQGE